LVAASSQGRAEVPVLLALLAAVLVPVEEVVPVVVGWALPPDEGSLSSTGAAAGGVGGGGGLCLGAPGRASVAAAVGDVVGCCVGGVLTLSVLCPPSMRGVSLGCTVGGGALPRATLASVAWLGWAVGVAVGPDVLDLRARTSAVVARGSGVCCDTRNAFKARAAPGPRGALLCCVFFWMGDTCGGVAAGPNVPPWSRRARRGFEASADNGVVAHTVAGPVACTRARRATRAMSGMLGP